MEIDRNEETKMISVWLDHADQRSVLVKNMLDRRCPEWKKEGYQTVIYRSGNEDLYENTLALLRHNRRLRAPQ